VWPSHSQISSFSTAILALEKARSRREPNLGCRGADRPGRCDALPEKPARRMESGQTHCRDEADLLARSLWMRRSQAQSTASYCRLTSPTEELLLTDAQWSLLWLAANFHQGHETGSRDIRNGWILSGQPS